MLLFNKTCCVMTQIMTVKKSFTHKKQQTSTKPSNNSINSFNGRFHHSEDTWSVNTWHFFSKTIGTGLFILTNVFNNVKCSRFELWYLQQPDFFLTCGNPFKIIPLQVLLRDGWQFTEHVTDRVSRLSKWFTTGCKFFDDFCFFTSDVELDKFRVAVKYYS